MNDLERISRDWPWMTSDQIDCMAMFCQIVGGLHHFSGKVHQCGYGIKINTRSGGWSTYDQDRLTALVVLAHENMVRVEVVPSGPRMVGFELFKRHHRDGRMFERHPTIECAIGNITQRELTETTTAGPQG